MRRSFSPEIDRRTKRVFRFTESTEKIIKRLTVYAMKLRKSRERMATVQIAVPFERQHDRHGIGRIGAWKCLMCPRVELSYQKIVQHVAVEHGWRPVKNLKRAI